MARREERQAAPIAPGAAFDVVAVAASAGGLKALTEVLSPLPPDFGAAVVVVQHLDRRHRSVMAEILDRCTDLDVTQAKEGDVISPGRAFVAPPDHHLLVGADGVLTLSKSELVHFLRPAADLLFQSIAAAYGNRAIALVLTGSGRDGSMGVEAVKTAGGTVIAQDEATSEFRDMPAAAVRTGKVDLVLPLNAIPAALVSLIRGGTG
jgi:two-component system, chemotaxis family, protein-glutamate methylesterase/glutaminase